jgi:hypothetical protein
MKSATVERGLFSALVVLGLTCLAWVLLMPGHPIWFGVLTVGVVIITALFNLSELREESLRGDPDFLLEQYVDAQEFAVEFEPRPGVDYDWVVDYAEGQFERVREEIARTDSKANSLVNYGTAFSGVSAAGFAVAATQTHWSLGFLVLLVVFCAAQAIKYANDARLAGETPLPPEPTSAFEYADTYDTDAEAKFGAQYVAAYMVAKICAYRKGRLLTRGAQWFKVAVYLIVVGLLVVVCFAAGGVP